MLLSCTHKKPKKKIKKATVKVHRIVGPQNQNDEDPHGIMKEMENDGYDYD